MCLSCTRIWVKPFPYIISLKPLRELCEVGVSLILCRRTHGVNHRAVCTHVSLMATPGFSVVLCAWTSILYQELPLCWKQSPLFYTISLEACFSTGQWVSNLSICQNHNLKNAAPRLHHRLNWVGHFLCSVQGPCIFLLNNLPQVILWQVFLWCTVSKSVSDHSCLVVVF